MTDGLFSALFPDTCRICDLPLAGFSVAPVCQVCLAELAPSRPILRCLRCARGFATREAVSAGPCGICQREAPAFDRAAVAGPYEGALRRAIHLLKYDRMTPLARPLGERLALAASDFSGYDAIVPAPLHWGRRWDRGFNQADLLAREVSRRTGVPLDRRLLRTRPTPPQAGLSATERRLNVRGAFKAAGGKEAIRGKKLIVVDDVMTTGATLEACARALKRVGAAEVAVLTLARADLESRVT
ncbi:MAG TPA: ComF family protein [Hyphomicrobiales bacterium]|nr:ComF family protein [Hyphomicrobiales bacterium]